MKLILQNTDKKVATSGIKTDVKLHTLTEENNLTVCQRFCFYHSVAFAPLEFNLSMFGDVMLLEMQTMLVSGSAFIYLMILKI